ncbi:hypothetical protein BVX97_00625, partial [bacterium E08(2017)]
FMCMRFFFPVTQWLHLYQVYRATGDERCRAALLGSARHYNKLSQDYPLAVQHKANDPEGLTYMYTMSAWSRITLQLARKGKASEEEIAEAEKFLETIIMVLKPVCEGDADLDPEMGIPKKLAEDFRIRPFNRSLNGIGVLAMTSAALKDLQTIKETDAYQTSIDRYRKCVKEYFKNWKSVGCLYTEEDGKTYFYYPYVFSQKLKRKQGVLLAGDDQGHYSHSMQGVMLVYESTPELGADDDFMTAIANAIYHNSYTKYGSIQCPTADKIKPNSRHPFNAPRERFYMFEAWRDGLIDGQCSKLSAEQKKAALSNRKHRPKVLHAMYMKALRKDRDLIYLGEKSSNRIAARR